jgi:hypothetical protein
LSAEAAAGTLDQPTSFPLTKQEIYKTIRMFGSAESNTIELEHSSHSKAGMSISLNTSSKKDLNPMNIG